MLIDTHCHLNFHAFKKDLPDVVRRAKEKGVEKMIVPGTDVASSLRAVQIAQEYPECFAAVGIHPHHAHDPGLSVNEDLKNELSKLLTQNRVVAVGEIGMDFYKYQKTKYTDTEISDEIINKQKQLLLMQLELAQVHKLPVILHCREAHDEMIQTISAFASNFAEATADKSSAPPAGGRISRTKELRGVWHCFGGNKEHLQSILTMGYYVGFDGNITYSKDWQNIVRAAPLERILLETDAPFLTPVPYRSQRNEPAYLPIVAQAVADIHHSPLSEVIHLSTTNAQNLFKFV